MLKFHYCEKFKNTMKKQSYKEYIYKKINENIQREDLKGVANIDSFVGGVYVLKTIRPRTRIIIEKK